MDCLVVPVLVLKRRCSGTGRYTGRYRSSGLGYPPLLSEQEEVSPENPSESHDDDGGGDLVSVVVGKEKREFLVDPIVLQASPFRVLIQMLSSKQGSKAGEKLRVASPPVDEVDGSKTRARTVIFVDVDVILFEHMLWLLKNDYSSFFNLNLREIIDFYCQDN